MPPVTIGPTGCTLNSNDEATPKLPPPPRRAQKRSAFSLLLAVTTRPSAVTSSTLRRLSTAMPYLPMSHPRPPPRVRPATPVDEITPPVLASPCSCVSRLYSFHVAPPWTRAVLFLTSTCMPFISDRSISSPPSIVPRPATLWPPPLMATSKPLSRASVTASTISAVLRACAISAGRLSMSPLWTRRPSSNPASVGCSSRPLKRAARSDTESAMNSLLGSTTPRSMAQVQLPLHAQAIDDLRYTIRFAREGDRSIVFLYGFHRAAERHD